jgi:hypothetical protein
MARMVLDHRAIDWEVCMAKSGKEKVIPPSKKDLGEAGKELRKGSGPGGRVLVEKRIAKQQGVKRPKP